MNTYLAYLYSPLNIRRFPYVVIGESINNYKVAHIDELATINNTVITYDFGNLVDYFRTCNTLLPKSIIDISLIDKLIVGLPQKNLKNRLTVGPLLSHSSNKDELLRAENILNNLEEYPTENDLHNLLTNIYRSLINYWSDATVRLRTSGELDRYYEIEKPINEIFLSRQYAGIRIDESNLVSQISILEDNIYLLSKEAKDKWGIKNYKNKSQWAELFRNNKLKYFSEHVGSSNFEEYLSIGAECHDLLHIYHEITNHEKDLSALLKLGAISVGRIYPIYDTIGTITGRIIVRNPTIQHLKKTSRNIIVPDDGYELLYPDYCQFEPGIMADESRDANLTYIYNNGDIYAELSKMLYGNHNQRKLAKKIFLAYSFGMKRENIISMLEDLMDSDKNIVMDVICKFFDRFSDIELWKKSLNEELIRTGRVGTKMGNYRYRVNNNNNLLEHDEERWVVSQRIQGTASLIFKKALIRLVNKVPDVEFLIPMHDAILCQIPAGHINEYKDKIKEVMLETFKNECSTINPNLTFEPFYSIS